MALFPSYSDDGASTSKSLFPSVAERDEQDSSRDHSWLHNPSFVAPLHGDEVDQQGDVGDKSRHKRKKTHRRKDETKTKEKGSVVSVKPDTVWISDTSLDPSEAYRIDGVPDLNNLTYDALYSGDIASYKRKFECLGLSEQQTVEWTDGRSKAREKEKKRRQVRYFKDGGSQAGSDVIITSNPLPHDHSSDFICLEHSDTSSVADPPHSAAFTAHTHMAQCVGNYNRTLLEQPHNVSLWLEFISFQDQMLEWGYFTGEGGEMVGKQRRALLERKVAIFEKAIESNPLSVELLVGHMTLVGEFWETERLTKRWKDMVFHQPNKPRLWLGYILYCQTNFSSFTTASLTALYCKCISTLSSIVSGTLKSHLPDAATPSYLLAVFTLYCNFLRQVGHTEKAVACYQALIEFNLCSPAQLDAGDVSLKERLQFFETFWDSGVRRFGEPGAPGWGNWTTGSTATLGMVSHDLPKPNEKPPSPSEGDPEMDIVSGKGLGEAWMLLEDHRATEQVLPWRPDEEKGESEEDTSDPDRIVLFDDVSSSLFQVTDPALQLRLVLSFLHFLGAPVHSAPNSAYYTPQYCSTLVESPIELSPHITCSIGCLLSWLQSSTLIQSFQPTGLGCSLCDLISLSSLSDIGKNITQQLVYPTPSLLPPPRDMGVCNLITSVCNQAIGLLSDPSAQTQVAQVWIAFQLSQVAGEVRASSNKEVRKKIRSVQKLIKSLLRLDSHRNDMLLWRCCALVEHLLGNCSEMVRVFEGVLSQQPSAQLYSAFCECVLGLQVSVTDRPLTVNTSLALHAMLCFSEGKYSPLQNGTVSPARLLRARAVYEKQPDFNDMTEDQLHSVLCHAYFEYLSRGLKETCTVFDKCTDMLTSTLQTSPANNNVTVYYLEQLYTKQANLILHHSNSTTTPPSTLRRVLEKALTSLPNNPTLLALYISSEQQSFVSGRLRRFFNNLLLRGGDTPTLWLYFLASELARYCQVTSSNVEITEENSLGIVNRIVALLSRATASDSGRHCPLLWRLYMAIMAHTSPDNVSSIFYQAIHNCPWVKVLYYEAVYYVPNELEKILEIMEEKEIRLRTPLEEVRLLQKVN